jgi:uncharacterized membrane protein
MIIFINWFSLHFRRIVAVVVVVFVAVAVGTLTYGSSSSSRKRYVLQYTKLNSAKTNGNVIREMTSILFDLEHFLK